MNNIITLFVFFLENTSVFPYLLLLSSVLMNCYQWGSCLPFETTTKEPMELAMIINFHQMKASWGSNSRPFDPKLNALNISATGPFQTDLRRPHGDLSILASLYLLFFYIFIQGKLLQHNASTMSFRWFQTIWSWKRIVSISISLSQFQLWNEIIKNFSKINK